MATSHLRGFPFGRASHFGDQGVLRWLQAFDWGQSGLYSKTVERYANFRGTTVRWRTVRRIGVVSESPLASFLILELRTHEKSHLGHDPLLRHCTLEAGTDLLAAPDDCGLIDSLVPSTVQMLWVGGDVKKGQRRQRQECL
jgi:hypothetical protein